MDYLDAVVEATGEHDSALREILQEDYDEEEVREFLCDAIRSKIRRDFVASRLKQTIENTATVPDLDDPPGLQEGSGEEHHLVRKYLDPSKFVSLLQDGKLPEKSGEEPTQVRKYLDLSKFVSLLQDGI
jgi:hypothetical protein